MDGTAQIILDAIVLVALIGAIVSVVRSNNAAVRKMGAVASVDPYSRAMTSAMVWRWASAVACNSAWLTP